MDDLRRSHIDLSAALGAERKALTEANATIAALRDALDKSAGHAVGIANRAYHDSADHQAAEAILALACANERLDDHPIPPAAAKLLAERDAGRALYEAVRHDWGNLEAVEAYRKVVEA